MDGAADAFLEAAKLIENRDTDRKSTFTSVSRRTGSSRSMSSSERRERAAAKAARIEAELEFLKLESEKKLEVLKREEEIRQLQAYRELAGARAELSVLSLEEERDGPISICADVPVAGEKVQEWLGKSDSGVLKQNTTSLIPEGPALHIVEDPVRKALQFTPSSNPEPLVTPTSNSAEAIVKHLAKPVCDIKKFGGDPLEYNKFVRQFQSRVIANSDGPGDMMNYLEQYTFGEAHRVIVGYGQLNPTVGFDCAMTELKERYGDKEIVASAYVKKALNWGSMKADNPKALDEFGMFLCECHNAISDLDGVRLLEYPDNIKRLVAKLPYGLQERWRTLVNNKRDIGQSIKFVDFVGFVKKGARKACHPIYGRSALASIVDQKSQSGHGGTKSQRRQPAAATNVNTVACWFCKGEHSLEICGPLMQESMEKRIEFIRGKGLCFGCLRSGHRSANCKNRVKCKESGCGGRHPTVLHRARTEEAPQPVVSSVAIVDSEQSLVDDGGIIINKASSEKVLSSHIDESKFSSVDCVLSSALLMKKLLDTKAKMTVVPVILRAANGTREIVTNAFMDNGSSISFIDQRLMNELNPCTRPAVLNVGTVVGEGEMATDKAFGLEILPVLDVDGRREVIELPAMHALENGLPVTERDIVYQSDIDKWSHLDGIKSPDMHGTTVGLLLGGNVVDAYSIRGFRSGLSGSPTATKTRLGWLVWSVLKETSDPVNSVIACRTSVLSEESQLEIIDKRLRKTFNHDFPESIINDKKEWSREDKAFMSRCKDQSKMVGGHHEIPLPLKPGVKLPNNRAMADSRLKGLKRKLSGDERLRVEYTTFMDNMIESGYAEIVPLDEIDADECWYLPHHGVRHPTKHKLRVVFDCAAKFCGISLNDALLQGPDLTNNLVGVLLRFRERPVAVSADIEAMFLQVKVPKEHCDFMGFLWWKDGDLNTQPVCFRMLVHLFGATSSPSCANLALQLTSDKAGNSKGVVIQNAMSRSFYVDDYLKSFNTESEAITIFGGVKEACADGGFRLHKIISSSRSVMQAFDSQELAASVNLDRDCDLPTERALGVVWDAESDELSFCVSIDESKPITRRGILSTVSAVYDPLGLASPFVLPAKILLQELCKAKLGWDDPIGEIGKRNFETWVRGILSLNNVKIPRCVKANTDSLIVRCELHYFADASESGYGVVCYLRCVHEDCINCRILVAKSKVAPLKKITIPRMELTAAALAVSMNKAVTSELDIPISRVD